MATITANLQLPPADAVAYFRQKGLFVTWDWHEARHAAQAEGFTVAKATSLDVLGAIQDMADKAVNDGITFQTFLKSLRPRLQDLGWWGKAEVLDGDTGELTKVQLGSVQRLRTIYETNVRTAHSAGRYKRYLDNVASRPYWRYVAVMDSRTRPAHQALHGKVWRWDDPIWQIIWPPNGWGCRCTVQALSEAEFQRLGVRLENGHGMIDTVQVLLNKAGDTMDVRVVKYLDERGRKMVFRPDPGWDYNPGAAYSGQQALARVLAQKVDKVPPIVGATVAANIATSSRTIEVLDNAWRSWVQDVMADPVSRKRQMLAGFLRPQDVAALAGRNIEVDNVSITVEDSRLVGRKAQRHDDVGDALSDTDWLEVSSKLREPQAVLLDKRNGTLLYVLSGEHGQAQRIVVAPAYRSRSRALMASLRSAYWANLRDLRGNVEGGALELIEGSLG